MKVSHRQAFSVFVRGVGTRSQEISSIKVLDEPLEPVLFISNRTIWAQG